MRAVFPGTFDPFTLGHWDILNKARRLFAEVVVLVIDNSEKKIFQPLSERLQAIRNLAPQDIVIDTMSSQALLADFVRSHGIGVIVRGLRHSSDFNYEWPMAHMNAVLAPECQTIFLMPDPEHMHISSTMVREILKRKGDASAFVPPQHKIFNK